VQTVNHSSASDKTISKEQQSPKKSWKDSTKRLHPFTHIQRQQKTTTRIK